MVSDSILMVNVLYRGSYTSVYVILHLLSDLGKSDKMRVLPSILSLFGNEFNKFNNTGAQMLDSIFHMSFKKKICMFGMNTPRLCHF